MIKYFISMALGVSALFFIVLQTQKLKPLLNPGEDNEHSSKHMEPIPENARRIGLEPVNYQKHDRITERIEKLQDMIEKTNIIGRLNNNQVSLEERENIFELFQELNRLRTANMENMMHSIENEVKSLEEKHQEKLKNLRATL